MDIEKSISSLKKWFSTLEGSIIAFSGGVDSALVLYLSRMFLPRPQTIGVISNSESLKAKDYQVAVDFAKKHDIILKTIYTEELKDNQYNTNPGNRCYFCKTHLYLALDEVKKTHGQFTILNGTNKDDLGDHRPGLKAAGERAVRSPLAELALGKKEVRALARHLGLSVWNKPASPCLSSRIPYGLSVTGKKLRQVEAAENLLNDAGFSDVRVRHYGSSCKIEVPAGQIQHLMTSSDDLIPQIKEIGFEDCVIDTEGLVSGKMNRVLKKGNAKF